MKPSNNTYLEFESVCLAYGTTHREWCVEAKGDSALWRYVEGGT